MKVAFLAGMAIGTLIGMFSMGVLIYVLVSQNEPKGPDCRPDVKQAIQNRTNLPKPTEE